MQDVYGPALGFLSEQAGTALLGAGTPGDRCRVWELLAPQRRVPGQAPLPWRAGPQPPRCTSSIQAVTHNLALLGRWHMQLASTHFTYYIVF